MDIGLKTGFLSSGAGVFVCIMNLILTTVIISVCEIIGFKSHSMRIYYSRVFILIIYYFNAVILITLMGAKLDSFPKIGYIFDGQYKDFTEEWYGVVGVIFISTLNFYVYWPIMEWVMEHAWVKVYFWQDQGKWCG